MSRDHIAKAATGNKRRKKQHIDLVPILPPQRPDAAQPWNAQKCLAWADYARQMQFTEGNRRDSKYAKAQVAATVIEGLGITENTFLILYFNWMKGIDLDLNPLGPDKLKSETWPNYSVDLWIFVEHYADELRKYKQAKVEQAGGGRIVDFANKQQERRTLAPQPLPPYEEYKYSTVGV